MKFTRLIISLLLAARLCAAPVYVDSSATGTNTGASWVNAFTTLAAVRAAPGDVVWISGGPTGSSRAYTVPPLGYWNLPSGTAAAWITYRIATDDQHNGTAIFNASLYELISGPRYFTFSGLTSDGVRHFKLNGFTNHAVLSNIDYFHIEGIDGSAGVATIGQLQGIDGAPGVRQCELNDCYFNVTDMGADHALFFTFAGANRMSNTIHDNWILVPNRGPGTGADGLQGGGTNASIYRNHIEGYFTAYTGGQHQDGYQMTGGENTIYIYDNHFVNIANYSIYGDGYFGGFTDIWVYDNIISYTDQRYSSGTSGGIVFGVDGGYSGAGPCIFTRVILVHNVIADLKWIPTNINAGMALDNRTSHAAAYVGCVIADNIFLNDTTTPSVFGNSTTVPSNNVALTPSQAASQFVHYVPFDPTNDFRLLPTATLLIGKGIPVSGVTLDRDGNPFDPSKPSIGAYESGSSAPPVVVPPVVPPAQIAPSGAKIQVTIP